jgi:hypothetical protein
VVLIIRNYLQSEFHKIQTKSDPNILNRYLIVRHQSKQQRLADFETTVLNNIWDEAQDMMHRGGVTDLAEVDKHFWTARVFDGKRSYEVEILLDGKRIKGFTCDCWVEHRNLMCKHVAAGAGALRQYLNQRTLERNLRKQDTTPISHSDKLNIATILKRTPPEAVAAFVQEYASEDKAFATLLKSRFATWLTGEVNYYRQIMDGLIPEKHAGTLSPAEQRKVQRIIDDLVRQQKGAVAEHDLHKAWLMSTGIIHGLPRLVSKMHEMYREPYHGIFQNAFLFVLRLEAEQVSPELWEQRRNFIFELIEHKFLNDNALRMLVKAMEEDADFWDGIALRWEEAEKPYSIGLLTTYAASLVRRNVGTGLVDVLRHFVEDRDMAVRLVMQLYHLGALREALQCGQWVAEQPNLTLVHKNTIGQLMLASAQKLGDQDIVQSLLEERLMQSSNLDYYEQMRDALGDQWDVKRLQIQQRMREANEWRLLCTVLMHEKEFDQLFALLCERNDFALLHLIEKPLIVHKPKQLTEVYVALFSDYLEAHFGHPAADFIRGHLMLLLKVNGADVGKAVSDQLTTKYADRTALIEVIQEVFPKGKKIRPFLPRI